MTLEGTNTYVVVGYVIDPGPNDAGHLERVRRGGGRRDRGRPAHPRALGPLRGGRGVLARRCLGRGNEGERDAACGGRSRRAGGAIGDFPSHSDANAPSPPRSAPSRHPDSGPRPRPRLLRPRRRLLLRRPDPRPRLVDRPARGGRRLARRLHALARRRSSALDAELLAPGHGPWITDPAAKIAEYASTALDRERRLVAALEPRRALARGAAGRRSGTTSRTQLRPAAAIAMQAHLEKLDAEGRLARRAHRLTGSRAHRVSA